MSPRESKPLWILALFGALLAIALAACFGAWGGRGSAGRGSFAPASTLPDLSGLAWIEGDRFIAAHDAKRLYDPDLPRVSLVRLASGGAGVEWRPLSARWPGIQGLANDLESAARIPGTERILLAESGDEGGEYRRIFVATVSAGGLEVTGFIDWPVEVRNVEGIAVASCGRRLVFLYAERAHGQRSTLVRWADLQLEPLAIGSFQELPYTCPDPVTPHSRPVSALETDGAGNLYCASAVDPGDDNGPFRSAVWRIGRVEAAADGAPRLVLDAEPQRLAVLDGFKIESLAIRETESGPKQLFLGTDDENFGGDLRVLPLEP